jgi:hypothetical protein
MAANGWGEIEVVDIPASTTTTGSITVGGTVTSTLETFGDHDWFRIQLTAGQKITITLNGTTLQDPFLRILNSSGAILQENDDISSGVIRDSRIVFTAPTTGTYYIDAGAWQDNYVGDYQLNVTTYVAPSVWTYDQIADQLIRGYWGGTTHRFNVSPGGQITVNLTGLTPEGQTLARGALATWTDVIGIRFLEVAAGGQIVFDDDQDGAHADSRYSGSFITSSNVNVSTQWLSDYGTRVGGYAYQTYIHEIGHALGLGHAGNYNGDGDYQSDALYANDSWATTVMSYFSQTENTYFSGLGFDRNFLVTPMVGDMVAMSKLYGLSTTTRSGDTVYGSTRTRARSTPRSGRPLSLSRSSIAAAPIRSIIRATRPPSASTSIPKPSRTPEATRATSPSHAERSSRTPSAASGPTSSSGTMSRTSSRAGQGSTL